MCAFLTSDFLTCKKLYHWIYVLYVSFSVICSRKVSNMNFRRSFQTEQRAIYRGHDILQNPVPKPIRHDLEDYNPPAVKFETETSNKV